MACKWPLMKLSDVADVAGGGTPSTKVSEYYGGDISWLTPKDLSGYKKRYISKGERSITQLGLDNSSAKILPKNSVLLTSRAPIGYVAIARNTVTTNQGFKSLILKEDNDPEFFYYLLKSSKDYLESLASGSTFKEISGLVVKNAEFRIPSYKIQKRISRILGVIDERIENNQNVNQTLEQMAQAIFKSWFVDFEPTKAKIAVLDAGGTEEDALLAAMTAISGKNNAELEQFKNVSPEQYDKLKSTAELFPSEMQDSELGEIPYGWKIESIGEAVTAVGGGTPSTKNPEYWDDGVINWTTPKDLSSLQDKILTDTSRKITEQGLAKISSRLLSVDTVLMSSRAPVGYLALAKIPVAINQGYIAMKCDKVLTPEYVLQWCSASMEEIKGRAGGTTFAEISRTSFREIPVIVPSQGIITNYSDTVKIIYELITKNILQTKTLAEIRDTLLPRLLSGEIDVSAITD
ncbi:MAG TPA: restriction endonuclease subunit S [Alcaligenaceae bacterium]|nr:restriction endonuclease subunit S [Alcaligenaceae bacterium]